MQQMPTLPERVQLIRNGKAATSKDDNDRNLAKSNVGRDAELVAGRGRWGWGQRMAWQRLSAALSSLNSRRWRLGACPCPDLAVTWPCLCPDLRPPAGGVQEGRELLEL